MPHNKMFGPNLRFDLPAGLVVFLVALPLCLGIALASGAPLVSGLIAGIVGGLVVGPLSGSMLSVSGPAAGLTVIVLGAIQSLGGFDVFLAAVILAGGVQVLLGLVGAGIIGYYFPSSVIKGMLAGIGVILILKQIPHALGFDATAMGVTTFSGPSQLNTFAEIVQSFLHPEPMAAFLAAIALMLLLLWQTKRLQRFAFFQLIPGPLVVVVVCTLLNEFAGLFLPAHQLGGYHLVNIPHLLDADEAYRLPQHDWGMLANPLFWKVVFTLAVIASIESLLSLEASDKLDPWKRISPPNRELMAQGVGNMVSGFLGGLPLTSVIVRSSANVTAGARTRISAIFHGLCLLGFVLAIPALLNRIPLSALAAILLFIGYRLSTVGLYRGMYKLGYTQFLPFVCTVVAIVFTDLLSGIAIGMCIALFYILRNNFRNAFQPEKTGPNTYTMALSEEVSYLNKGAISKYLRALPEYSSICIDGRHSTYIDQDVLEVLRDFKINAAERNIRVDLIGINLPERIIRH
ncbi:MAG: SulP family inorganic anion transporter [Bacteroidia bacterium]